MLVPAKSFISDGIWIFYQLFVGTSALSMWRDNLIKIPIGLKEKRQTISYGKFHWKDCLQKGYVRKNTTLICVTRMVSQADLNF